MRWTSSSTSACCWTAPRDDTGSTTWSVCSLATRLEEEESPAEREALTARVTSWLLRMATMAGRWLEPGYGRPGLPDPDLVAVPRGRGRELAAREHGQLAGCVAVRGGSAASTPPSWIARSRCTGSPTGGCTLRTGTKVFTLGAEAAGALGDLAQHATRLNYLAWVHLVPPDDPETTLRCAAEALDLATRSGATLQIAWAHQYSADALRLLQRNDEAIPSASRAIEMFKAADDIDAYCQGLAGLAYCLRDTGRREEALVKGREAYDLAGDEKSGMTPTSRPAPGRTRWPISATPCGCSAAGRSDRHAHRGDLPHGAIPVRQQPVRPCPELARGRPGRARPDRGEPRAYARAAEVFEAIGRHRREQPLPPPGDHRSRDPRRRALTAETSACRSAWHGPLGAT